MRTRLGPDFAKLWTANAVSNLGDGVTLVAGPLLAASLTRSPLPVAALTFAQRLPWLLFSLLSGALVDRLDRRRVMMTADLFRAAVIGLLGVAVLLDAASIPLLCAALFLLGTAETLFDTAAISILPAMVPRESLTSANGRLLGAQIVTNDLAAPPLGGLLFATAAAVPFLLNAGSFMAAAILMAALSGRFRVERLGLGPVGYGVLLACLAVGGIAASLVASRVIGWLGPATTMRIGLLIEASTHLVLPLTASALVAGAVLALFGFHAIIWSVVSVSLRQELIPGRLLGRVNSVYAVFSYGGSSLGALLGGLVAGHFGLTAPFWCGFVVVAVLAVAAWPILSSARVRAAREQAATES